MQPQSDPEPRSKRETWTAFVDTMTHRPIDETTGPLVSLISAAPISKVGYLPTMTPRRNVTHSSTVRIRATADYELKGQIGEGGMGVVYEGRQNSIDRLVALKLSKSTSPKSSTTTEPDREAFLAEAVLTGHLEHPNIIPIYDLGVDDQDQLFYVMKRVQGTSWHEVIREKSVDENLEILLDVADAVAFAHSRRIIHRDLKPHNVMLGAFGEVLLTDWGLALPLPDENDVASQVIPGGGTPAYMAPEMARGDGRQIGLLSDVYLLGAILYEIITGLPPHRGSNAVDCIGAAAHNRVEPPSQGGKLAAIALKAMATEPADRFDCVQDFQQTIRDFRSHAESHRLCERARQIARRAQEDWCYETFGLAIATYQEALKVWAKNDDAYRESIQTRVAYADCACRKGDLDLAESLLTAADCHDSPIGEKVRLLKEQRRQLADEQLELRAKVEKWTTAFLASPDCVLITRLADGTILEANDVFLRTMGCSRDEVVGKSAAELNNWVDLSDREYFVRQLQQVGECTHLKTHFRTMDEEILPMDLSGRIVTVGDETAVISHARDLSSDEQAEQELRDAKVRIGCLRAMLDSMPAAMIVVESGGAIMDCNAAACSLFHISRDQAMSATGLELLAQTDMAVPQTEELLRLAATGKTQVIQCRFALPDDDRGRPAEVRFSKLAYDNFTAVLCVITQQS